MIRAVIGILLMDHEMKPNSLPASSAWIFGWTYIERAIRRNRRRWPNREEDTCRKVQGRHGSYSWVRFRSVVASAARRSIAACRPLGGIPWGLGPSQASTWSFLSLQSSINIIIVNNKYSQKITTAIPAAHWHRDRLSEASRSIRAAWVTLK